MAGERGDAAARELERQGRGGGDGGKGVPAWLANASRQGWVSSLENMAVGLVSGAASTLIMHPIDLIKVRFQMENRAVYASESAAAADAHNVTYWGAVRTIYRTEGLRGFFRGAAPAMWGSSLSWGIYFTVYEARKHHYRQELAAQDADFAARMRTSPVPPQLPWWHNTLSAFQASTAGVLVTNPIWLVKTRLQLQSHLTDKDPTRPPPYRGMLDALRSVYKAEGVRGLYRGLGPAMVLTSNGVIQFTLYEELKSLLPPSLRSDAKNTSLAASTASVVLGAVSKTVATTMTYPYQVLKSRMQARDSPFTSSHVALRTIFERQGVTGLYGGFGANLVRVVPGSAVTIATFEFVKAVL